MVTVTKDGKPLANQYLEICWAVVFAYCLNFKPFLILKKPGRDNISTNLQSLSNSLLGFKTHTSINI